MRKILLLILIISIAAISACKKTTDAATSKQQIVTAKLQKTTTDLYYIGTIRPLQVHAVTSPADGTVESINFQYGHPVVKGQVLAKISSSKLEKDYRTALTSFLKAKNAYVQAQASFVGTTQLWKSGIVDDESYNKEKSTLETSQLSYLNAKQDLEQAAENTPGVKRVAKGLSLEDIAAVKKILEKDIEHLTIKAPLSGIALFPEKTSDSTSGKQVHTGSQVKQGQILVTIGNLTGISVMINVDEVSINRIKVEQKVVVTSPALPELVLNGYVKTVAAQAKVSENGGGGVTFAVQIVVPRLTPDERKIIHVGMNAKVELQIQDRPMIYVPIKAVKEQKGQTVVTILDQDGKQKVVPVQTGRTTQTEVAIISGLKPGDKVVVHD